MASNGECSEATQVLLIDPQTLPVLLRTDTEDNAGDISVDLLQQALQGTSAMDDGEDVASTEQVSLNALSNDNNDVVAIYQGEEVQTIKISFAEAESLGLHFTNDIFPVSMRSDSLVGGMKVNSVGGHLTSNSNDTSHTIPLSSASLLQSMSCANIPAEGRIIDEEGNIVETSEPLQILPSSLTALLEEGMGQSLSIIPQYELDGTVTYAVKLKDQNDTISGTDYNVLEPDSSAKTGLDIEEELKNASLKHNILQSADAIRLSSSINLNEASSTSSSIQVPVSTFEALSKQMLLPVSNTSIPISVTLSMPTETAVPSPSSCLSSNHLPSASAGRFFHIVSDRSSFGINNTISSNATAAPLSSLATQSTISANQQHPQLINPSSAILNVQNSAPLTLLSQNKCVSQSGLRQQVLGTKLSSLLSSLPKNISPALKTPVSVKKVPIPANVVTSASSAFTPILAPALASMAPNTTQPNMGVASVTKCPTLSNGRVLSSNPNSSKPLGSSENPIQLVQQGQTFHSMQALSQAQLRQIATVLQQKHLNSNSTATKNVLFDEQTKTRIVYRVVYPEDVDLQQPTSPTDKVGNTNHSGKVPNRSKGRRGRPKRTKRVKLSASEKIVTNVDQGGPSQDNQNSPVTSLKKMDQREEVPNVEDTPKVEKKKVLGSRTRSGRMSRPPKHMMKDYKHLHHTDYKEKDADDSDGGYSDYSNSEQPPAKPPPKEVEVDISPAKKRISRFNCPTCNKLYLGLGRMEKHFLQHPDHGSFEEFKQMLSAPTSSVANATEETMGEKDSKSCATKANFSKGKKRSQGPHQPEKERSEIRKKKLKQALQACEMSEIVEVAGPLIARYYSLWDLLLLRLVAKDESNSESENINENIQNLKKATNENDRNFGLHLNPGDKSSNSYSEENGCGRSLGLRATSNRVQWLLMEISSLADTLQSMARDLFLPAHMHDDENTQIEISEKTVSEMFGVSCGMYTVNEQPLYKKIEGFAVGLKSKTNDDVETPPQKRSRINMEAENINTALNHKDTAACPESLSTLSLMVKPAEADKVILSKLTEDMPFLNSSDDMICGSEDPDLSTDSKRDPDCDSATGIQVVDDIVNERLKNLSDNMNFSVQLQGSLEAQNINGEQSELHLMSSFGGAETSVSVSNSSVTSSSLNEGNKPSVSVSNMDLMSSYSISSLSPSVAGAHDVNISNSEPSNDLTSALEPVTSQSMLGSFGMGLSSLSSFDALQAQSSSVPHSEDSFLDSLSSFETPLTQTCTTSNVPSSSYDDSVMKSSGILHLESQPSEPPRLPPKFISSFTPAITNDKTSDSISTAQRLQRTYLELDGGLDDGLDLDFEALTEELNMNRNSSS